MIFLPARNGIFLPRAKRGVFPPPREAWGRGREAVEGATARSGGVGNARSGGRGKRPHNFPARKLRYRSGTNSRNPAAILAFRAQGRSRMAYVKTKTLVRARALRRKLTNAETILWSQLRDGIGEMRFRRQHPIGPYIADFACIQARLVVEVDGSTHASEEEQMHDARREAYLRSRILANRPRHKRRGVRLSPQGARSDLSAQPNARVRILSTVSGSWPPPPLRAACPLHRFAPLAPSTASRSPSTASRSPSPTLRAGEEIRFAWGRKITRRAGEENPASRGGGKSRFARGRENSASHRGRKIPLRMGEEILPLRGGGKRRTRIADFS